MLQFASPLPITQPYEFPSCLPRRWLTGMLAAMLAFGMATPVSSAEPALRDLLPGNWLVRVELQRPGAILEYPLVRDVAELIASSPAYRLEQSSVDRERLQQAYQFLEQALGTGWKEGFDRLTEGGVCAALTLPAMPGGQPGVLAVVRAKDNQTLTSLLAAVHERIAKDAPQAKPQPRTYAGIAGYQLATLHYAVRDQLFYLASRAEDLEAMLTKPVPAKPAERPADARIKASVDLDRLRTIPGALKIEWPAKELGQVLILGGYLDVIRSAHHLEADLTFAYGGLELTVEADAGSQSLSAGLQGFFGGGQHSPAALLELPGAIASSSWVRDYAPFWENRQQLATSAALASVEEQHQQLTRRNGFGPFDVLQHLGPRWRVAVARQTDSVYRRRPRELLPALVAVAEVRDEEKFRKPIYEFLQRESRGLLTLVFGYGKTAEYKGATVVSVRLSEPENQPEPGDFRYSLNPAMSFTRGQFIAGTTEQIVEQTIDELDRHAALAPAETSALALAQLGESVTDVQQFSLKELGVVAGELRDRLVKQAVLERGLVFAEAETEVNLIARLLSRINRISTATQVSPTHFRFHLKAAP